MVRVLLFLCGLAIAACAPRLPALPDRAAGAPQILAPFEAADLIPDEIARLPFADGRAYAILVQIPAPSVVDLSHPERARRGLIGFLNPLAVWAAGTSLGHTMAGWRCVDGTLGLVAKTGDSGGIGQRMVVQGWGLAAFLSDYHDGHLTEVAQIPDRHRRVLREGRARIVAVEIPESGCQAIRRTLVTYRTHPAEPERGFTMLRDPADLRGDGCAEFALWLIGQGGAFAPVAPHLRRTLVLRDSFVGRGSAPSGPVTPLILNGVDRRIALLDLVTGDWTQGRAVGTVEILDLELMRVMIDRAYGRAYPVTARLDPDDADVRRVTDRTDRYLAGFARVVPVRIGRARAMLLDRRPT